MMDMMDMLVSSNVILITQRGSGSIYSVRGFHDDTIDVIVTIFGIYFD